MSINLAIVRAANKVQCVVEGHLWGEWRGPGKNVFTQQSLKHRMCERCGFSEIERLQRIEEKTKS